MVRKKHAESTLKQRLGIRIATRRKALGWTQFELAERIDVDTETISRFERGVALPSLLTLEKLCDTLQTGVEKLLAETSRHPDDQATTLNICLAELTEDDRHFVMAQFRQTCDYLKQHADTRCPKSRERNKICTS